MRGLTMDCVVPTIRYFARQPWSLGQTSKFSLKVRGDQSGFDGDPAYSEIPIHRALELSCCTAPQYQSLWRTQIAVNWRREENLKMSGWIIPLKSSLRKQISYPNSWKPFSGFFQITKSVVSNEMRWWDLS